ncbi:LamG domain-containing protein [candidate division WS5 bacterium]|uniref:LamG domain-containing protein n=1 Tax=candidate division WS5 bacterium TaxID=2093353 RepID=A0A419DB84_9BACT|nr:MAG: LamG domain-containing protein [candidate division WS5 bacterium]
MKKLIAIIIVATVVLSCQYALGVNTYSTSLETDSSQYWSIGSGSQTGLQITSDMTLEFWLKAETEVSYAIMSRSRSGGAGNRGPWYLIYDATNNRFELTISSDGTAFTTSQFSYTILTGEWHHFAFAYTASAGTVDWYVDAVAQTQQTGQQTSIVNVGATFEIADFSAGGWANIDGLVDDVRVWNDVRTSSEISNNYQTEQVGNEAGLVGYWKFNNDGLDETANNNDLTNNNSATFSTDIPFPVAAATQGEEYQIIFE